MTQEEKKANEAVDNDMSNLYNLIEDFDYGSKGTEHLENMKDAIENAIDSIIKRNRIRDKRV